MEHLNFSDIDHIGAKLLDRTDARLCVRNRKAFIYINNQRFNISDTLAVLDVKNDSPNIASRISDMKVDKDITIHGVLHLWDKGGVNGLYLIDDNRKFPPVVLRFNEVVKA